MKLERIIGAACIRADLLEKLIQNPKPHASAFEPAATTIDLNDVELIFSKNSATDPNNTVTARKDEFKQVGQYICPHGVCPSLKNPSPETVIGMAILDSEFREAFLAGPSSAAEAKGIAVTPGQEVALDGIVTLPGPNGETSVEKVTILRLRLTKLGDNINAMIARRALEAVA